ncbi:MAG: hypothetical protein WED06_01485, partial [Candidatus Paceibacterota bacterium]
KICKKILKDNLDIFMQARGARKNHQAWPGGYLDHLIEVMNIAVVLYTVLNGKRQLPFSLSDALLILFLHDLEKPWKYEANGDGGVRFTRTLKDKEAQHSFRARKIMRYGIRLTPEQMNAFKYVEGENRDYSSAGRVMNPLAAFCHMCDVASARIWFDHPLETGDEWTGAVRANTQ